MSLSAIAMIALTAMFVPAEAKSGVTVNDAAMVASCRFRDGQSAHLIVPIGSRQIFVSIRNRAGAHDLSTIEYGQSGTVDVETNGGIAKIQFIHRLMGNLMRGPFRIATNTNLHLILAEKPKRDCGLSFQLSPK